MSEQKEKSVHVNIGLKDGVAVAGNIDLRRYEITVPNKYDAYWMLKSNDFTEFEPLLADGEKKDWTHKHFFVPLEKLESVNQREQFNIKVAHARTQTRGIQEELDGYYVNKNDANPSVVDKLKTELAFEGMGNMEVRINQGIPYDSKLKKPFDYMVAEVLSVGKFFVLFKSKIKDEVQYLQAIESNRFLKGKEFENREQAIANKFKVGDEMFLSFKDGKAMEKFTDYQKDLNKGMSQAEALDLQIARDTAKAQDKEIEKQASLNVEQQMRQAKNFVPAEKLKPKKAKEQSQARSM
jgi:hypothetical protein